MITSGNRVYFQSFSKIYIYDYQKFTLVQPQGFINSISDGGDRIFVNIMDKGVFQIKDDQLTPYRIDSYFNHKEIRFIISLSPSIKLIGTSND